MNTREELITATHQAEECFLGAILIESTTGTRDAINAVPAILSPMNFNPGMNRQIYEAMLKSPEPPHQINVARQMLLDGKLEDGVVSHLCFCVSIVPCSLDYMDYAHAVKDYSELRQGRVPHTIKGAA